MICSMQSHAAPALFPRKFEDHLLNLGFDADDATCVIDNCKHNFQFFRYTSEVNEGVFPRQLVSHIFPCAKTSSVFANCTVSIIHVITRLKVDLERSSTNVSES